MKPTKRTVAKTTKKQPPALPKLAPSNPDRIVKVEDRASKNAGTARQTKSPKAASAASTPKTPPAKPVTLIAAKVDVGFGNTLYIRGQGLGLAWDRGFPLSCLDSSTWVWSANEGSGGAEFKLLINDQIWSKGENLSLTPGERIEVVPSF